MDKNYNVLMLCMPASGHLLPFISFASELAKNKNVKLIMYSNKQNRKAIESANIEFRDDGIEFNTSLISVKEMRKSMPIHKMLYNFMDSTEKALPELVRCVREDNIDLIIYDSMTVHAKWLMRHLESKYQRGELKKPPPKAITFVPTLLHEKGVYPNSFEEQLLPKPTFSFKLMFNMLIFFVRYIFFCRRISVPVQNPFHLVFYAKEPFIICCVVPELQPRYQLFPKSIKFVGNCASEEVRSAKEFDEPLKSFLAPFAEINPMPLVNLRVADSLVDGSSKLIYISLGTVVNTDIEPFLRFVEGINQINRSSPANIYKFLMSVGDSTHAKFQTMANNKEIVIPANLLIMPRVPQLDVLKRTSLFITHAGQGSVSESIHYGVPMICIPVMGDQPAVAYRVADELGLGIQLNFDTFNAQDIKNAVTTILNDKSYLERVVLFSQISRKYNGTKEATRITIEYLQKKNYFKKSD